MDPTVPTAIAGLIPILATSLSALFITDKLTAKRNALIALIAIVLTSIACEALTLTSGLPGNKAEIFLATLGYIGVFMRGDLGILYNSLLTVNSTPTPPANLNPVRIPTALVMPSSPIPPRASAQPPDV